MKHRMIFKVICACINFIITCGIGILVPRILGPIAYGEIGYINASMTFVLQFTSIASSTAYIYFLSNNRYDHVQINTVYFVFLACIIFAVTVVVGISIWNVRLRSTIWDDLSNVSYVYLGMMLSVLLFMQQRLVEFADCQKHTIISEKIRLAFRFIFLVLLGVAGAFHWLDVNWYYILFISCLAAYFAVFLCKVPFRFAWVSLVEFKKIVVDMFRYLKPLIFFTIIATFYSYAGRFVLQQSSGLEQQGYYTFAFSIAMIYVGILTSIMTIYMNRMTDLFNGDKIDEVRTLFLHIVFKVYAGHAFISLFCLIYAKEIILLLVGDKFIGATGALQWLAIFSLLHTFGLLSGNLFFSSGRTKTYGIINSSFMCVGLLCFGGFFLNPGWELNATILAAIMTLIYGSRVLVQLYFNVKHLDINKTGFISELVLLTGIILLPLIIIVSLGLGLIVSLCLSFGVLLILNFSFKDYLQLKRMADGFNKKTSISN